MLLRYRAYALALKAFSSSSLTREFYRILSNRIGQSYRIADVPEYYYERAERNVALCQKHLSGLSAGDRVLELGTGWMHWEAITLRLFFDFSAVLYDVCDKRQLGALKHYVRKLASRFETPGFMQSCDLDRARWLIRRIEASENFDSLYRLLGFRYVCDPKGLMETLPRETFRLVISAGVMEHLPAEIAAEWVNQTAALLRPGGVAMHDICISDHLAFYDARASQKQYLAYSRAHWNRWLGNVVQYTNLIQRGEWLRLFEEAGFAPREVSSSCADIRNLKVHRDYRHLTREDIECGSLLVVLRKEAGDHRRTIQRVASAYAVSD